MKIGINEKYQIQQLRDITDEKLTVIDLDETSEFYPFKGWSDIKILCYCYNNDGGISIYPYVDIDTINKLESYSK